MHPPNRSAAELASSGQPVKAILCQPIGSVRSGKPLLSGLLIARMILNLQNLFSVRRSGKLRARELHQ